MVALKLANFGGMIPAVDANLLPDNQASLSENAWVYSGAIEGFRELVPVHTLANPLARKVFRIPTTYLDKDHIPDSYWMEFSGKDVDVLQSPTVDDSYDRFYWVGFALPARYNTKARILAGSASYKLGIPSPAVAPSGSVAGGTVPVETRAYVYTWESIYGEEGPPSPPTLITGNASGTWNITVTAPTLADTTERALGFTNIYRTITGTSGSTAYFLVAQIPIATLTYADTVATTTVASNQILQSLFWTAPPADIKGMVAMPNGIIAGFSDTGIWFTEPYRPHAWPAPYQLSVESPIIGLGVIGQSLIVCTSGSPYSVSGVNPGTMTLSRIATNEPCVSRGSIVSGPSGVAYASPNGIVLAVPGAATVVTRNIIGKDLWSDTTDYLTLPNSYAAALNGAYYAWGTVALGCFDPIAFDPGRFLQDDFTGSYQGAFVDASNTRVSYNKITSETPVYNCFTDVWTGEVFVIRDGKVYWMDVSNNRPHDSYTWKSKIFEAPNQRNFGAMRVYFSTFSDTPELNPVANTAQVQTLAADQWGLARVYADGILRFTRELRKTGEIFKLPSGFKAQFWQIEIEARVKITSVEFATSAKELGNV